MRPCTHSPCCSSCGCSHDIVYRNGDLFSSASPALGHGVNTLGGMGAGIAVEFRRRWPTMYDAYAEACQWGCLRPGGIFVYQAPNRLIVNMATQQGVGRGSARLEWVREVARQVSQLGLETLALPRIAAGLGGLAWDDVAAVLEAELAAVPSVEVWALPARVDRRSQPRVWRRSSCPRGSTSRP